MSAVRLWTLTCLCLFSTAVVVAENKGVVWRKVGDSITIQCQGSSDSDCLYVKMGLHQNHQIFFILKSISKKTINPNMEERIQTHGKFPNVQILIKNLSVEDTGPYWCLYSKENPDSGMEQIKGQGSVLLVVTENKGAAGTVKSVHHCEQPPINMVVVSIVGAAVVLLLLVLAFVLWMIRRHSRHSVKPSRVATNNNDVYEDMRATIRR